MDSFEVNKILGAVLATLLVVMSLGIVSEMIFEREAPEQPGYAIAALTPEHGEAGGGEAAAEEVPIAVLLQDANPEAGAASARKCQSCHTFEKGGPARVGPNLWGIVGASMAHAEGFNYSSAMMEMKASSDTWTFEKLNEFLTNPKAAIPGTAMSFAGLKRDDERANVIAYLRTLSDNPVPLPEAPSQEAMTAPEPTAPAAGEAPMGTPPAEGGAPAAGGSTESQAGSTMEAAPPPAAPTPEAPAMAPEPPQPPVVPPAN